MERERERDGEGGPYKRPRPSIKDQAQVGKCIFFVGYGREGKGREYKKNSNVRNYIYIL